MAPCGFGEECDLTRSEVLQNRVRDCSSCDVCDNLHEQVSVSSLLSKVMPMLSADAEGTRFTESRLSSECLWNQLGNLRQEDVRHGSLCSDCRVWVWVCWVKTFDLWDNLLRDWYWWAFLAAARARPRSPDRARVATLRTRHSLCSAADLREELETGATSHSARNIAQRAGQSSPQKRASRASRKCTQLLSEALTAGRPRRSQLLSTRTFHAGFGCQ